MKYYQILTIGIVIFTSATFAQESSGRSKSGSLSTPKIITKDNRDKNENDGKTQSKNSYFDYAINDDNKNQVVEKKEKFELLIRFNNLSGQKIKKASFEIDFGEGTFSLDDVNSYFLEDLEVNESKEIKMNLITNIKATSAIILVKVIASDDFSINKAIEIPFGVIQKSQTELIKNSNIN